MNRDLHKAIGQIGWVKVLKELHENAPDPLTKTALEHAVQYCENLRDSLTGDPFYKT